MEPALPEPLEKAGEAHDAAANALWDATLAFRTRSATLAGAAALLAYIARFSHDELIDAFDPPIGWEDDEIRSTGEFSFVQVLLLRLSEFVSEQRT
jgi:hypothetical protein